MFDENEEILELGLTTELFIQPWAQLSCLYSYSTGHGSCNILVSSISDSTASHLLLMSERENRCCSSSTIFHVIHYLHKSSFFSSHANIIYKFKVLLLSRRNKMS